MSDEERTPNGHTLKTIAVYECGCAGNRWHDEEPAWANLKLIVSAEYPDHDFKEASK